MVTWQNRIFGLCIPVLMMTACGQGPLVQPDLIGARYQSADKALLKKLDQTDLATIDATAAGDTIFLGFSQTLNGDLIETVVKDPNNRNKITGFTPIPGIIKIYSGASEFTDFTTSYRPDGGYIPKPDTPVSDFPPPAIAVTLTKALPASSTIMIYIVGKIANPQGIFMAPVVDANGTPAMGQISFKTK